MFTVNRQDIFLSIPVDSDGVTIDVSFEYDSAQISIFNKCGVEIDKSLTLQEVCDLIDALTEVKKRME